MGEEARKGSGARGWGHEADRDRRARGAHRNGVRAGCNGWHRDAATVDHISVAYQPGGTITLGDPLQVNGLVFGDTSGVDPTGTVALTVSGSGGATRTLDLSPNGNGTSSFTSTFTNLGVGAHTVGVHYNTDGNYEDADGSGADVTVNQATPTVTANPSATSVTFGQTITVSGSVTGPAGGASGSVTIRDGGSNLGNASLSGAGTYTSGAFALGVGTHQISAHYNGEDGDYNQADSGSTPVTVGPAATDIHFTSAPTTNYAAAYFFTGNLTSAAGTPTGSVAISIDGGGAVSVPLSGSGAFSLPIGLLSAPDGRPHAQGRLRRAGRLLGRLRDLLAHRQQGARHGGHVGCDAGVPRSHHAVLGDRRPDRHPAAGRRRADGHGDRAELQRPEDARGRCGDADDQPHHRDHERRVHLQR